MARAPTLALAGLLCAAAGAHAAELREAFRVTVQLLRPPVQDTATCGLGTDGLPSCRPPTPRPPAPTAPPVVVAEAPPPRPADRPAPPEAPVLVATTPLPAPAPGRALRPLLAARAVPERGAEAPVAPLAGATLSSRVVQAGGLTYVERLLSW